MKPEEAELLIIRSQLEVARDRVASLEDEERRLLLALGRDPDKSGIRVEVKNDKQLKAVLALFRSPEFAKRIQAASKTISKAFLSIEKRQFKKSKGWRPLPSRYHRLRVRKRVQ